MKAREYLALVPVALVVSFFCGAAVLAAAFGGPDPWYWLFLPPASVLAVVVAAASDRFLAWPDGLRRGGFVAVSAAATALFAICGYLAFQRSYSTPDPDFVYVHGTPSIEIHAPAEAVAGKRVVVTARRVLGPWELVPFKGSKTGDGEYASALPSAVPSPLPPSEFLELHTSGENNTDLRIEGFERDEGTVGVTFQNPGRFFVWVETVRALKPERSNVVQVTVRPH